MNCKTDGLIVAADSGKGAGGGGYAGGGSSTVIKMACEQSCIFFFLNVGTICPRASNFDLFPYLYVRETKKKLDLSCAICGTFQNCIIQFIKF